MVPELGNFLLIVALTVSMVQVFFTIMGAANGRVAWMGVGQIAGRVQFALISCSFGCLVLSFLLNDFSVLNVAKNSNSSLPWPYRVAASWGSHEGSMLLWLVMLSGWTFAVSVKSRQLPIEFLSRILGTMGLVSIGFLLFTIFTSNPFERLVPPAVDGADLNPLLQDPGMVIHPPLLYMGYVGCTVPFAFAIAALLGGRLDITWARWSRPWTTSSWVFLTIGIALGSWWAYYELGWGGWWFWDPVENASFMPWLSATALIHSLAVSEKRGGLQAWSVLLAIVTFALSLLGTFLVRSGVITSVHAFASDPERGVFILLFLVITIGSSLALYAVKAPRVGGEGGSFQLLSREGALMANNVIFLTSTTAILLGTLYPLFLDALGLGKISVGPPYFDVVFVSLMAPGVFLMGIGPLATWQRADATEIIFKLKWAMLVAILGALLVFIFTTHFSHLVALGVFLAFWVMASSSLSFWERYRAISVKTKLKGFQVIRHFSLGFVGMLVAHVGVSVFIIGVTCVGGYEKEEDLKMKTGDVTSVAGYSFKLEGFKETKGPNYDSTVGVFSVYNEDEFVRYLNPEKRFYHVQQMLMTEAAIDTGLTRDLYLSLGEPLKDGSWVVRVYYKPFVDWIWGGAFIMALGGLIAILDRRFRATRRSEFA